MFETNNEKIKFKEIKERFTVASSIFYIITLIISLGIFTLIHFVFTVPIIVKIIGLIICMFGTVFALSRLGVRGIGTYQHILKTGTKKQIKRADTIIKIIGYGISFICAILAILVLFIH